MTYNEIVEMLKETGLPSAYDHFEEGESPDPPFLVFLFPDADNFSADGTAYAKINELHIELYTDLKQPDLEEKIEEILESHELFYAKSEVWIADERLYEVLYSMEVLNGSNEEE